MEKDVVSVILYNVRSAHNVGSIFRTADGVGVHKLYLCGYTPTPVDRFGREQPDIAKTALGAHTMLSWEYHENTKKLIHSLQKNGVTVVAVEQHKTAIDYKTYKPKGDVAVLFGSEVDGVEDTLCTLSDVVLQVPMYGSKESLNVSVVAGIVLYRLFDSD